MFEITQQIEEILDKRLGRGQYEGKGRLQAIENSIARLTFVKERALELDALITTIASQLESKTGSYYDMFVKDPEALAQFEDLKSLRDSNGDTSASELKAVTALEEALGRLRLLKLRFEREALRIAFIGRERQGKSTFIKTITGLNDKVIPAYSGGSCTGTVSVIHNVDRLTDDHGNEADVKVVVDYHSVPTYIEMVNEKLKRFFPENTPRIGRPEQLTQLNLPEALPSDYEEKIKEEYSKFKKSFVDHYADYANLIGVGKRTYYDEDTIAEHVAQYEEFPEEVPGSHLTPKNDGSHVYTLPYYKYLAVKNVDIYKRFAVDTTKKLELVDTIGIGGAADSAAVEKEMFRVMREDCDGAINLFKPANTPNFPDEQVELLQKIKTKLSSRETDKWVVYVINKIQEGAEKNFASAEIICEERRQHLKGEGKPVAWVKAIDGKDFDEVKTDLVSSLLELIASNLDYLDTTLISQANDAVAKAYNECLTLVKAASSVSTAGGGLSQDAVSLFDEVLYPSLIKKFGAAMNLLDQKGYALAKDKECSPIEDAYEAIVEGMDAYIPDEDAILERFETGTFVTPNSVFEDYVEQMRNDIFTAFEDVNAQVLHPLQEKVKLDIIRVLFEDGLLKNLPTPENEPSIRWLEEIMDNYVPEEQYAYLRKALQFVLDYQINIEGMVEYHVTRGLYVIDRTHPEFITYKGGRSDNFEEQASEVWNELCNRLPVLQKRMRDWISSFTMIPSHSFYSRVHKFHVKLLSDEEGRQELRRLYRKNMGLVWGNEINASVKSQKAFGEWTDRVNAFKGAVNHENFKTKQEN